MIDPPGCFMIKVLLAILNALWGENEEARQRALEDARATRRPAGPPAA